MMSIKGKKGKKGDDFLKSNKAFFPMGVGVTNFLNVQKILI